MVDKNKIIKAVQELLEAIGEDTNRQGLKDTPDRVARMYEELTCGYNESVEEHLSTRFKVANSDMIIEKNIPFSSLCEHHLMPFFGKVSIAYIPNDEVVGLSKLARCVEVFARHLQIQERMTNEIAESIYKELNAKGVLVLIEAEHTCMTSRGVNKIGTKTVTVKKIGNIDKNEAMQLIMGK